MIYEKTFRTSQTIKAFFVKAKSELEIKKMRAEICYNMRSGVLFYDQILGDKNLKFWKKFL